MWLCHLHRILGHLRLHFPLGAHARGHGVAISVHRVGAGAGLWAGGDEEEPGAARGEDNLCVGSGGGV